MDEGTLFILPNTQHQSRQSKDLSLTVAFNILPPFIVHDTCWIHNPSLFSPKKAQKTQGCQVKMPVMEMHLYNKNIIYYMLLCFVICVVLYVYYMLVCTYVYPYICNWLCPISLSLYIYIDIEKYSVLKYWGKSNFLGK